MSNSSSQYSCLFNVVRPQKAEGKREGDTKTETEIQGQRERWGEREMRTRTLAHTQSEHLDVLQVLGVLLLWMVGTNALSEIPVYCARRVVSLAFVGGPQ